VAALTSTDRQRGLLGPGLEEPALAEALAGLGQDPEVEALLLPLLPVDLDLLISDAATAAHWAGSRWHGLGHIRREGASRRHEHSLAASLDPAFAQENWGFLAQQCVENLLKGLIVLADQPPPLSYDLV
jgi:hypothetical protein